TPISSFSGAFDGLNNTISHLTITGSNGNVGLFNSIAATGIVKNFTLSDVNVSGAAIVGALAGTNAGTISNITASGTVTATGSIVGGVIGSACIGCSGSYITSR